MKTPLDCALEYLSHGWMVIPIPPKSKNPNRQGWQKERHTKEELPGVFIEGINLGLLLGQPSGGLTDVDLDSHESHALAARILPKTEMIGGRASAPHSHYWYLCSPLPKTAKFLDPSTSEDERAMLLEFRGTGCQTVVSPSVHPCGEFYEWYGPLQPAEVSGDALLIAVRKLAAAALVMRHWKEGQRHNMALAISGMFLRAGWQRQRVENFIRLIATAANDEDVSNRVGTVEATELRLQAGESATGQPALADIIGDKTVANLRKWLGLSLKVSAGSCSDSTAECANLDDTLDPLHSLSEVSTSAEIESALRQFAASVESLDALARELARNEAIRILKECDIPSPARLLSAAIPKVSRESESSKQIEKGRLELKEPESWPEMVEGAALLDEIAVTIERFVSAANWLIHILALWVLYAHVFNAFDISPLLAITSPEKRCGKTTLLTLLRAFVPRPLAVSNITASALFRTIEMYHPVLLIDEADTFLTDDETMRGIINSGHHRPAAHVIRTTGDDYEPRLFTTWTPKIIAMIGALPSTVEDRAFVIKMQRKRPNENKERLRLDRLNDFEPLCCRAARWAADNLDNLRGSDPGIPEQVTNDRARDNWRVLLAIADAGGGKWPELARKAAISMLGGEAESESPGILLLHDMKAMFNEQGDGLSSEQIVKDLTEIEARPWSEWKNNKPITKTGLARLLKPFGIRPQKWREGKEIVRGYQCADFQDAFARYVGNETSQTPQTDESTTYSQNQPPQPDSSVAVSEADNSNGIKDVAFVADEEAVNGAERERFEL